jgi:hypothetical protein
MSTITIPSMAWTPSTIGMSPAAACLLTEGVVSRHDNGFTAGADRRVRFYGKTKATATAPGIPAWRPPLS